MDGFDDVAEFLGNESEEEDDAQFVDRLVAQSAEVESAAIGWAAVQRREANFAGGGGKDGGFWFGARSSFRTGGLASAWDALKRPYRSRAGRVFASKSGHDMSCPYRFMASGLWRGFGEQRYDIGPFGLALSKIAKDFGKC